MRKYLLITESALDTALMESTFSDDGMLPIAKGRLHKIQLSDQIVGFRVKNEPLDSYLALVSEDCLELLEIEGGRASEVFRRITRVVKGLKSPPVHLPRQWSEYHYRNLLAFIALPREASSARWVVEFGGTVKCARFDFITSDDSEINLANFTPSLWPEGYEKAVNDLLSAPLPEDDKSSSADALAQEVDLKAIGSASVVEGRSYEEWERYLTDPQKSLLNEPLETSLRIVGPAGSGKTLSLCMRALQVSRNEAVIAQGKRILVATHSWAMSERIDGILSTLNGGYAPTGITVFPLLSLLELHAGHIGQHKIEVIGDDSTDGRVKSLEIITEALELTKRDQHLGISPWISDSISAAHDSRARLELIVNLYEEISGVISASGVAPDDNESIREYINSKREDWMPPFPNIPDRGFVISVYRAFMQELVDRGAITTDQFILDSIRILETFAWRMRKETEGYDYIFVDELQLFDPQERTVLELLGRQKKGVPFITAEDPSQGVFSTLNSRRSSVDNVPVYLDVVHRFNREIFEFIAFIYQKFPLNALPLKIRDNKGSGKDRPKLYACDDTDTSLAKAADIVSDISSKSKPNERICVVTLGDVDKKITDLLVARRLQVVRLTSFDDIEQLSYSKRTIVVSPWEFIGGTQFSHVVVLGLGIIEPNSQFGRLREMISVYLSCSRATDSLSIVCDAYVPALLMDANQNGLLVRS